MQFLRLEVVAPLVVLSPAMAMAEQTAPQLFISTQLAPVDEAWKLRSMAPKDVGGEAEFQPNDNRPILRHLATGELSAGAADGSAPEMPGGDRCVDGTYSRLVIVVDASRPADIKA